MLRKLRIRLTLAALTIVSQLSCDRPDIDTRSLDRIVIEPPVAMIETNGERPEETIKFLLRNQGSKPFSISSVTATCGCTKTELDTSVVLPGKEAVLTARINSIRAGSSTIQIEAITNQPDYPKLVMVVNVKGIGKIPYVAYAPEAVSFGAIRDTETSSSFFVESREMQNTEASLFPSISSRIGISFEGGFSSEKALSDGIVLRRYDYVLKFRKTSESRDFRDEIVLKFRNSDQSSEKRIPVSGAIVSAVQASPSALFGTFQKIEEIPVFVVTFRGLDNSVQLKILPSFDANRFSIEKVAGAESFRIRVTGNFDKELNTQIKFKTNLAEMPEIEIPVRLMIRK